MVQAPEHSGKLSHRPAAVRSTREVAPTARRTRAYYETLSMTAVGIELSLSVVLGALLGHWADGRLGTHPLFMIVLLGVGFAAGIRSVVRTARRAERREAASKE
jgi:ATP synthase protein I